MYCTQRGACPTAARSSTHRMAAAVQHRSCMHQQRGTWHLAHRPSQRQPRARRRSETRSKMYVPSDSFGGQSPERKASTALQTLFTFIAVKVVLAQLEGSGRGSLASMNPRSFDDLVGLIQEHPMTDGDAWLKLLLAKNEMLAVRIMEVRATYSQEDFEWDQLQRLAQGGIQKANVTLMQQHAQESFTKRMLAKSAEGSEGSS